MSKERFKGMLIGIVMMSILFIGTNLTIAQSINKTITVAFNKINIAVNGTKVNAENISYNGTTYVPLRAISEMLGKEVVWNGNTSTADINDKITKNEEKEKEKGTKDSLKGKQINVSISIIERKANNSMFLMGFVTNNSDTTTTGGEVVTVKYGTGGTVLGETNFYVPTLDSYEMWRFSENLDSRVTWVEIIRAD